MDPDVLLRGPYKTPRPVDLSSVTDPKLLHQLVQKWQYLIGYEINNFNYVASGFKVLGAGEVFYPDAIQMYEAKQESEESRRGQPSNNQAPNAGKEPELRDTAITLQPSRRHRRVVSSSDSDEVRTPTPRAHKSKKVRNITVSEVLC